MLQILYISKVLVHKQKISIRLRENVTTKIDITHERRQNTYVLLPNFYSCINYRESLYTVCFSFAHLLHWNLCLYILLLMHTYTWHIVRRLGDASADCGDPTSPKILKMQILIASVCSLLVSETKVYYFINDTLETFVETFPST